MYANDTDRLFVAKPRFGLIIALVFVCLCLSHIPILNLLVGPLNTFVTAIHEMGHAVACILTGGQVNGMTIVSDGEGHGGLTFCRGGMPFVYTQAGYLGTALFGAVLIMLGRLPWLSRYLLMAIGGAICAASVLFMGGGLLHRGDVFQGLGSIFWGLLLGAALIWCGAKFTLRYANLVLLFIAVETGLNALSGVFFLFQQSIGINQGAWSDATNMAQMTGIPAFVWGFFWCVASVLMLGGALWWTYKSERSALS